MGTDEKPKIVLQHFDENDYSDDFQSLQIQRARQIMKSSRVFLYTWWKSSHPGMGDGAKSLINAIDSFLEDTK